jgi:hypothetical protein
VRRQAPPDQIDRLALSAMEAGEPLRLTRLAPVANGIGVAANGITDTAQRPGKLCARARGDQRRPRPRRRLCRVEDAERHGPDVIDAAVVGPGIATYGVGKVQRGSEEGL